MLTPQSILQGRYRILRSLGEGGMGTVYEALDQRLDCLVALKEATVAGDEARRAFQREASLLANLRHRALPNVMDHFSEGDGQFLVMEFIPGEDLASLLQQRGVFEVSEVLRWAEMLLRVLEYLHGRNPPILHRDIKPSNVKITEDDELFLLDFGLAKGSLGQMSTMLQSTRSVWGHTRVYAPLEQILGSGTKPGSDFYALGATLYHLISGTRPVDAPTRFEAIESGVNDPLPAVHELNPKVSKRISKFIAEAMAVSRKDRPESAAAMRKSLAEAIQNDSNEREMTTRAFPGSPKPLVETDENDKSAPVPRSGKWDEASFLQVVAKKNGQADADVAGKILAWCQVQFSRIRWGQGKQDGSFFPILDWNSQPFYPIVVYTYGRIEIQFQHMKLPPFNHQKGRIQLLRRLNEIPGVDLSEDSINRRPRIPLSTLRNDEALNQFFDSLAWAITEVKRSKPAGVNSDPESANIGWNGEFYVSFGADETRSWDDAVEYGFISAGGGRWYTQTLELLSPGDRVWVKVPGRGFVGVGLVTGRAQRAAAFKVQTPNGQVPVLEVAKRGQYQRELVDDAEFCEYFVPVRWLQTVPLREAIQETGMFGNQNTVCQPQTPSWRWTVERLKQRFPNFDQEPKPGRGTDLVELLNSIGKSVFVRYYRQFSDFSLSNLDVIALLPSEYTLHSRRSRTSSARRIFRERLERQALELILHSQADEETRKSARDLLYLLDRQ